MARATISFSRTPGLSESGGIQYADGAHASGDHSVLRPVKDPFQADGGLRVLDGNLGQAIVKTSAVDPKHQRISAPARVFRNQADFVTSYEEGELNRDFVAVVTHQGPNANGMPELHKLSPYLGLLQDQGHSVALLTDGRMSGASGKVLAAIHVTPEASRGGEISKIADGDLITIDATTGEMNVEADLEARHPCQLQNDNIGTGREMFDIFRAQVGSAASGASIFAGDASWSMP